MSAEQPLLLPQVRETSSSLVPEVIPETQVPDTIKQHRPWYRHKIVLVFAALLATAGIAILVGVLYLNWQFDKINQLSTPPPQVAGAVFDDAATAQVDTGIARQALDAAESGQPGQYVFNGERLVLVTPTAESTTESIIAAPEQGPGTEPAGNADASNPTPTSTPNPGTGQAAPTATQSAYAFAASKATLQAAELLGVPTETATVPAEPVATVTPTLVIEDVPVGDDFGSEEKSQPTATVDPEDVDPVQSIPAASELPMPASFTLAPVVPSEDGQVNILLMGVDAREGQAIDVGVRPDSLSVLHLDPKTGSCRILAIPRDTRTELPGYGQSKVNHALAVGGVPYEMLVVEQLLGIQIDHYGLVDFAGIEGLVDSVGGVTVNNSQAFNHLGFTFAQGEIKLDGEQALAYARYRYDGRGDFGRIERQQQVILAIVDRASGMDIVQSSPSVLNAMENHFKTDLSPTDLIGMAKQYHSSCTSDTLKVEHLRGDVATYPDPLLDMNLSYVVIWPQEREMKVDWLLNGTEPQD